jgi:hypothetical protein
MPQSATYSKKNKDSSNRDGNCAGGRERPLGFSRRVEVLVKSHLDEDLPICDLPHDLMFVR